MSAHFVPYDQAVGIPNVIVDGTANIGTVLTLSYWRRSGTPEELASDTSAEIVFKYLGSPHLHVTAEAVSNNHFDEDGLIGVFAFTQPDIALQHRAMTMRASRRLRCVQGSERRAHCVCYDTAPAPPQVGRVCNTSTF